MTAAKRSGTHVQSEGVAPRPERSKTAKIAILFLTLLLGGVGVALLHPAHAAKRDVAVNSRQDDYLADATASNAQKAGLAGMTLLPAAIVSELTTNVQGHFSLYLEDLTSGNSWGVDEDCTYEGWSLMKVVTMVAVLKKVERKELSLEDNVTLFTDNPREESSATPTNCRYCRLSVNALLSDMIELSDNVAAVGLATTISASEFQQTLRDLGMPSASPSESQSLVPRVSPRQVAEVLRSLKLVSYLNKSDSELALTLLSNTVYGNQIRAGTPQNLLVAHKVGYNATTGDYHDCGIVFLPNHPYILCIMSTRSNVREADRVMSTVSRQVYDFMTLPQSPHA